MLASNYLEGKGVFCKWILGERVCGEVALLEEEFIDSLLLLAFKNWEQIANKDFALGQATIGHYYENGIGVKKNVKIAAYWYEKAAIMKIK